MATNLRLRPAAEQALREAAQRSGRSQQDLIRDAVDQYLAADSPPARTEFDQLVAAGIVIPSRIPYRRGIEKLVLPDGMTSADLLDREDRF
jgi:hypothetical protein